MMTLSYITLSTNINIYQYEIMKNLTPQKKKFINLYGCIVNKYF